VEALRKKIEENDAQIDALQDKYGSNLESDAELRRLKKLKRNYQTDLENNKKALDSVTKKAKNAGKEQKRSTVSGPASWQKKLTQTPWKKGSTKQNRWTI